MASSTTPHDGNRFLDSNNRLSSAGAAASLKYASYKDLPSYPSSGLPSTGTRQSDSAAGAAASLGWANQKTFEHWKPDASSSAATAATIGWNHKAPAQWQPQQSASGAKAALLAAQSDRRIPVWKPERSAWGNSAATLAMKPKQTGSQTPPTDRKPTALDRHGSLVAATGAMSGSRKRAESSPTIPASYPDEANSKANALRAATHANAVSKLPKQVPMGGASPVTNMPKEMFSSNPPVGSGANEKSRADVIHASAIAMAQQMYTAIQKHDNDMSRAAALDAHGRQRSVSLSDTGPAPMKFNNLQEAAQRLAQERLAKLHDEHAQSREYRDYYAGPPTLQPTPSKLLTRSHFRRRSSSDASPEADEETSKKIRAQMSLFSSNLSKVDDKKRQQDRDALLAVAQRNVAKSLQGMDEKVFAQKGKVTPAMMSEWEAKARTAADQQRQHRMENYGKIDIGGGVFIDQSQVDAIALRNVQPVLDEIDAKTEAQRNRQMEMMLDAEEKRRQVEVEKARDMESKEMHRQLKEHEKEERKAKKAEEKASKRPNRRFSRHNKHESVDSQSSAPETILMSGAARTTTAGTDRAVAESREPEHSRPTSDEEEQDVPITEFENKSAPNAPSDQVVSDIRDPLTTPPSSPKGVKGWLKNTFRRGSKSHKQRSSISSSPFVGGANLTKTGAEMHETSKATPVNEDTAEASPSTKIDDIVKAERDNVDRDASTVSMMSESSLTNRNRAADSADDEETEIFEESRDHFDEDSDVANPTCGAERPISPARDSRFREAI